MILYHGSTENVDAPEIRKGDVYLDFGVGFYTTTSYEQAERWAKIKMKRKNVNIGYVSKYEFDLGRAEQELCIKRFELADEEWLTFVVNNRKGEPVNDNADMHIGPVADDNVYQSIRLFETGAYDAEYTVKKLKTEILHDQWTLHTDKILSYLKFIEEKEVK
ncbi:MAG: DUF3990 domain-containing protein [Lachnospiraceae bacterium]|nr:DUF3990 domain-containing protein [Lachnospiraceae bacterium]